MEYIGYGWKVTREEAIEKVGIEAVERVEAENCEWNSGGGKMFGEHDTTQTWNSRISIKNNEEYEAIYAIYFVEDEEFIDSDGDPIEDLSNIYWKISHYVIY